MSQTVHGGQHYTEAVEQWNTTAEFIIAREFHVFSGQETIIADIVMCQHNPFGKSGCS